MGISKTKGIIIAENNMNDFDKMVTILTPNGKIGCAAKGARRPKSMLMAATQFLCFGDYVVFKGGDTYNINSCEVIEVFYNIRTDIDKLEYASLITKIINDVTVENQNTYKILQLFLNTLYMLSETDKNMDFVLAIFEMRLASILGFMPTIDKCVSCGNNEQITHFSIKDKGFKCKSCAKQDTSAIEISDSTTNAIKYIIMSPPKKLFSFNVSDDNIKQLSLISKLYLESNLDKEYKLKK